MKKGVGKWIDLKFGWGQSEREVPHKSVDEGKDEKVYVDGWAVLRNLYV